MLTKRKRELICNAIGQNLINDETPLAGFVDIDGIHETVSELRVGFPENFSHMMAVKANSMIPVLKILRECGMGAEVASCGELAQAKVAGFSPQDIVFDEPAKTVGVIRKALELGVNLNIDNFVEFGAVAKMAEAGLVRSRVGFRINPQIGSGRIKAMSTASSTSKFGVPIADASVREHLIGLYVKYSWLNSLHTHVGSQGCSLSLMAEGVKIVVELAEEINHRVGRQQITTLDIGGGLSVNFNGEEIIPRFSDYAAVLRQVVPILFAEKYQVLTEFGRSIMAKNGFIVSRVEYAKVCGGRHIAITHAGVQIATRTVFMPDSWPLRITAHRPDGELKTTAFVDQDIVGPCCFAGDKVAEQRKLPLLERNDLVVLHDTGAYYFSNPFYYNSLPAPPVYGFSGTGSSVNIEVLRKEQTVEEMMTVIG